VPVPAAPPRPDPAAPRGPVVGPHSISFHVPDPDHRLLAVRLYQEVRLPGELLNFRYDDGDARGAGWVLDVPRPAVDRMEYLFQVTGPDGHERWTTDAENPARVGGAFGDKSVFELPGYRAPRWLQHRGPTGRRRNVVVAARSLEGDVPVTLWSPAGLGDRSPAPLLLVHDGPEYDELASLTDYLSSSVAAGTLPSVRAALLGPGHRDERYSADGAYARALCLAILPRLFAEVATTAVVGVGASLGALAMLHAQRQNPDCLDGLFLQSGSFFHPRHDAHERRFPRYDRVVRTVDGVLRAAGNTRPVPTVMTCGTLEENLSNNRIMARALSAQGYDVTLREVRDVHNYTAWRDAFDPWLTGLVREVARQRTGERDGVEVAR
jgi:enterochelin esterase-like enzyme